MRASRSSKHALLAAVFHATSVTARSSNDLLERQSTCPDTSQSRCAQSGLPDNFCCPSNSNCVPLAGNTTVLCCPAGTTDCSTIKPITCDISSQNVTLHPDNALKTTALDVPLTSCNNLGNCLINADQKAVPGSSSSSTATRSSSPTTSAAATGLSFTSSASASTTTPIVTASSKCSNFSAPGVVVGFFSGLVAGSAITLAVICLLGAQRRQKSRKSAASASSFGKISEPQPSRDMRTDFLRKPPPQGFSPSRRHTVQRVKSLFRREHSDVQPPMPLKVRRPPVTPPLQREPSFENISIFADGDTASSLREQERAGANTPGLGLPPPRIGVMRQGHETTFSDLMERSGLAGLQKGQSFDHRRDSPGYTPPR
ncbi:hypothetical protein BUE80_DR003301 [Diplocarpon rosae]|nr:hypothetical protein BUE80_DR003301 [Diplocarpon rosae]